MCPGRVACAHAACGAVDAARPVAGAIPVEPPRARRPARDTGPDTFGGRPDGLVEELDRGCPKEPQAVRKVVGMRGMGR